MGGILSPLVTNKPLRIVVCGFGQRGEYLARRLADEKWCRLVAVADSSPAALQRATSLHQVSTFDDFGKLLAATEADAAVICTPKGLLHEHANAALRAGVKVLLAQPPEIPVKDAVILEPEPDFLTRWRAALKR
jgi:predicted dehydrogenase